uniref:Uncharacterized protein n=1 Tax=Clastoptera arizonana TaxID=38151 RepID=A0A1B6C472_9HEMI
MASLIQGIEISEHLSKLSSLDSKDKIEKSLSSTSIDSEYSQNNKNGHVNYFNEIQSEDIKIKKRVNILTEEPTETTTLRRCSETSDAAGDQSFASNTTEKCLTMTGTIKRGS